MDEISRKRKIDRTLSPSGSAKTSGGSSGGGSNGGGGAEGYNPPAPNHQLDSGSGEDLLLATKVLTRFLRALENAHLV